MCSPFPCVGEESGRGLLFWIHPPGVGARGEPTSAALTGGTEELLSRNHTSELLYVLLNPSEMEAGWGAGYVRLTSAVLLQSALSEGSSIWSTRVCCYQTI